MEMGTTQPSLVTQGVRVSVQSMFVPEQSSAKTNTFCFAYRIEILNESPYPVQLLRRYWLVTDGYGKKRIVEGEGVIGVQPELEAGDTHNYVSGCVLPTEIGQMEGYYTFVNQITGVEFQVRIPKFLLVSTNVMN
jgi:ApaG protein